MFDVIVDYSGTRIDRPDQQTWINILDPQPEIKKAVTFSAFKGETKNVPSFQV